MHPAYILYYVHIYFNIYSGGGGLCYIFFNYLNYKFAERRGEGGGGCKTPKSDCMTFGVWSGGGGGRTLATRLSMH